MGHRRTLSLPHHLKLKGRHVGVFIDAHTCSFLDALLYSLSRSTLDLLHIFRQTFDSFGNVKMTAFGDSSVLHPHLIAQLRTSPSLLIDTKGFSSAEAVFHILYSHIACFPADCEVEGTLVVCSTNPLLAHLLKNFRWRSWRIILIAPTTDYDTIDPLLQSAAHDIRDWRWLLDEQERKLRPLTATPHFDIELPSSSGQFFLHMPGISEYSNSMTYSEVTSTGSSSNSSPTSTTSSDGGRPPGLDIPKVSKHKSTTCSRKELEQAIADSPPELNGIVYGPITPKLASSAFSSPQKRTHATSAPAAYGRPYGDFYGVDKRQIAAPSRSASKRGTSTAAQRKLEPEIKQYILGYCADMASRGELSIRLAHLGKTLKHVFPAILDGRQLKSWVMQPLCAGSEGFRMEGVKGHDVLCFESVDFDASFQA